MGYPAFGFETLGPQIHTAPRIPARKGLLLPEKIDKIKKIVSL